SRRTRARSSASESPPGSEALTVASRIARKAEEPGPVRANLVERRSWSERSTREMTASCTREDDPAAVPDRLVAVDRAPLEQMEPPAISPDEPQRRDARAQAIRDREPVASREHDPAAVSGTRRPVVATVPGHG